MISSYSFKLFLKLSIIGLMLTLISGCSNPEEKIWSEITTESKPWTRWWWMGNTLDKANITLQMEAFAKAGLGGVEITPIYGVKGYEDKFMTFLSPEWLAMLDHTLNEGERLNLGVDMVMGTGWPYGGPQVEPQYAASKLQIQTYTLKANKLFTQSITMDDPKQKDLATISSLISIQSNGQYTDLTTQLKGNKIEFLPKENSTLYAIFCSKTRQKVKRSAPGGEGYVLDHFSKEAFQDYALPYNKALAPFKGKLHAIFNDSYEVYQADFTPNFLNEFKQRRGYDLLNHIALLTEKPNTPEYHRLVCDYRETLSDLLLNNFANNWHSWANENTFKTKYQAHGSPGNLIDLYAAADIPECEMFGSPKYDIPGYRRDTNNITNDNSNKMMLKFCSSAAHLQGHEVVSSESFTWLREHFKTALSHCKPVVDDFFLSGVNHMFLHGSTYTIKEENWPGWKFYAAVNFNPTNTIWKDAPALFKYISRCQAILQNAKTDNDILIYWPIHDAFTETKTEQFLIQFGVHSIEDWLTHTSFYETALQLDENGFDFDYLSDRFLQNCDFKDGKLMVDNKASYQTIIVPKMETIPLASLKKLIALQKEGAHILFLGSPETVPGLNNYKEREAELSVIIKENNTLFNTTQALENRLNNIGIYGEKAYKNGLKLIRKKKDDDYIYFLANHTSSKIDKYVPFNVIAKSVLMMNPMNSNSGLAAIKATQQSTLIRIQLEPGESLFLRTSTRQLKAPNWNYLKKDKVTELDQTWNLTFLEGGPNLPKSLTTDTLESWTKLGGDYESFSGTAAYSTSFSFDKQTDLQYQLDLGDVRESARIYLNNNYVGTLFSHPFKIDITKDLIKGKNKLKIEVTNLAANRLSKLEKDKPYEWKKFHEINMVNIHYKPFDASVWEPTPSGLISTVTILSNIIE